MHHINPLSGERVGTSDWRDWRWQLAHALRTPSELAEWLDLAPEEGRKLEAVAARYPILATPYYLSQIRVRDVSDPVLRQILPTSEELLESGAPDPLAEERDYAVPRLVHRYPDRALFICTNACAVHCRHCMRKRNWDQGIGSATIPEVDTAVAYIRRTPQIRELILSGGDPLLSSDEAFLEIVSRFRAVPSLETIRIGTRVPVVLPQRLTTEFCQSLGEFGPIWVATHFNHPAELTDETAAGAMALLRAGIPVVNQTVLLKGINDSSEVIGDLCRTLLVQRIKPYYLFHGDPVMGTMHFRTGLRKGLQIMRELQGRLSGLAVPHFALDLPNGGGKVRLSPDCSCSLEEFESYDGSTYAYPDAGPGFDTKVENRGSEG